MDYILVDVNTFFEVVPGVQGHPGASNWVKKVSILLALKFESHFHQDAVLGVENHPMLPSNWERITSIVLDINIQVDNSSKYHTSAYFNSIMPSCELVDWTEKGELIVR